jgi:hypothetical protein
MNGYELTRRWFDFAFEKPEAKSYHTAVFCWIVELNNRLGWKSEFGLPTNESMEGLSIGSKATYLQVISDLSEWGFIKIIKPSKNQFQAMIISICRTENDTAHSTALDTALVQQGVRHWNSTIHGIVPIDKPLNNETSKPINQETIIKKEVLNFDDFGFFEPLIKRWLDYKKSQHNEKYKSQDTLNTFVKKLIELSNGQFEIAEKIIDISIASGYKGIFALKTGNGFNQQKPDKMESYKSEYEKAKEQIRFQNQ